MEAGSSTHTPKGKIIAIVSSVLGPLEALAIIVLVIYRASNLLFAGGDYEPHSNPSGDKRPKGQVESYEPYQTWLEVRENVQ